jgi:predicted MFS family arabinose efflux permease
MNVITGPMAGRLSDRIGRKPIIIGACSGLSLVMMGTTFAIDSRIVAYLFFALTMVMIAMRISPFQALITALVKSDRRGILMSLTIAIGQIGMGLGSGLAGIAYLNYGYLSNTIMAGISMMIMAVVVGVFIPEPVEEVEEAVNQQVDEPVKLDQ